MIMLRKADYHVIRRLYQHYADENLLIFVKIGGGKIIALK